MPEASAKQNGTGKKSIRTCFSDCHTDELSSHIGKESIGQGRPESEEDGEGSVMDLVKEVLAHGPMRRLPISEANSIAFGVSTYWTR